MSDAASSTFCVPPTSISYMRRSSCIGLRMKARWSSASGRSSERTLRTPSRLVTSTWRYSSFANGYDERDRPRLHDLWDQVIDSGRWSEGELTRAFERSWAEWNGLGAVAFSGWTGGALAALDFAGVRGETVLCPSNTFMATPLAALHAGAQVQFVDCNREDLCMSFADFEAKAARHKPRAAVLVHIGGHIAFDTEAI